jgi:hypothetical protein
MMPQTVPNVDFTHLRDPHRTTAFFYNLVGAIAASLKGTIELAKTRLKYACHTDAAAFGASRTAIQRIQITTRPECSL